MGNRFETLGEIDVKLLRHHRGGGRPGLASTTMSGIFVFLAGPDLGFITGQLLAVDGGLIMVGV